MADTSLAPMVTANEYEAARTLQAQGRLAEAERAYQQLAAKPAHREQALDALSQLYLQTRRPMQAVDTLATLTRDHPDAFSYCAQLAELMNSLGDVEAAITEYERLLARQPGLAVGHFNVARLYKRALRYQKAIEAYEQAAELGIDNVQEVYSNLGVVYADMRQPARAKEQYQRALEIDAAYVPALFNLATLHEEAGDRQQAIDLYEQILTIAPRHFESLARLGYAYKTENADDPLIGRLRAAANQAADAPLGREALYFSIGRIMDNLGQYTDAFDAYRSANELGRRRLPPYERQAAEQAFSRLIELFDRDWIASRATRSQASPIFVCGMFRSGSTLVEQMLGAHPAVTAAGELDFLPSLIARRLAPYPQRAHETSAAELQRIADEYVAGVQELFPDAQHVTDKRPDNFLHLGLVRAMFPKAKIVYTRRQMADNCLSIYFQQLGGKLAYATDLANIAHYYRQHERLMRHWADCLGASMQTVVYDELVQTPEPLLRDLLDFLELDWDDRCLQFKRADRPVRTASVWQVREELHASSSGRWQNYAALIEDFETLFGPQDRNQR